MNLALGTLAAALAVAPHTGAAPTAEPGYALPALTAPCVGAPCGGAALSDFALDLGEPGGPRAGEARVLWRQRLYLGVGADEKARGLTFSTARWDLKLEHRDDETGLGVEYRGPRLRLAASARDHEAEAGDGWSLDTELALRLSPDLEVILTALEDERTRPQSPPLLRPTSAFSLGALWQRGPRFELGGRLASATVESPGGLRLDRRGLEAEVLYQARRWRLDGGLGYQRLSGRFERREAHGDVRFSYRVSGRLVARAEARERYETDLGSLGRALGVEVTYYARRFRFARGGDAGRRTAELARRAWELGLNERRLHDLDGRRRLRQRLALSSARRELEELIDGLYRAQVEERNVALAGVAWSGDRDNLDGSRSRRLEAFVAVPWPRGEGDRAWRHDEAATDFLRFTYARSERDISSGFTTEGSTLALDVSLRRELGLRFSWERPAATGLEFALRTQQPRRFLARVVYRQGI